MSHHQGLTFILTQGQTLLESPLMYPTAEEDEEEEEVVAGHRLLLATWEFSRTFMAVEQATCQFNLDIMRHRLVRLQL